MSELPGQVTKHEFRRWLDAIDTYFAAAQHFEYPEVVLDKVRRFEGEMTQLNWAGIMAAANTDVPRNKKIDEWVATGKSGDFMGVPGADPRKVVLTADWEFVDKSLYLGHRSPWQDYRDRRPERFGALLAECAVH